MYLSLDPRLIVATLDQLHRRIAERFPDSGLTKVCADLCDVGRRSHQRAEAIERPAYLLRAGTLLLIMLGLALVRAAAHIAKIGAHFRQTRIWKALGDPPMELIQRGNDQSWVER